MTTEYVKPQLAAHGSIASLTMGKPGSDVDGESGMQGNQSDSDNTMGNGGMNAGS